MDSRTNDQYIERPSVETPEDVAVLYSWANLHGANYRDFSASRREYRAQLRRRAAEQARDLGLPPQAEAEHADHQEDQQEDFVDHLEDPATYSNPALRMNPAAQASAAAQPAAAERVEPVRRTDAATLADPAARLSYRDPTEAQTSARRNPDPSSHHRFANTQVDRDELPDKISDPYTPDPRLPLPAPEPDPPSAPAIELRPQRLRPPDHPDHLDHPDHPDHRPDHPADAPAPYRTPQLARPERVPEPQPRPAHPTEPPMAPAANAAARRPQGYRPDDASGVRQIYREFTPPSAAAARQILPAVPPRYTYSQAAPDSPQAPQPAPPTRPLGAPSAPPMGRQPQPDSLAPIADRRDHSDRTWTAAPVTSPDTVPLSPYAPASHENAAAGATADQTPRRRRQDQPGYRMTDSDLAIAAYRRDQGSTPDHPRPALRAPQPPRAEAPPSPPPARAPEPAVPEWLHAQQPAEQQPLEITAPPPTASSIPPPPTPVPQLPSSDTLQRSRERVASRWYALKGVFEQPGQERGEPQPVRQRETRTPVLAVFSFAGGVGKTSLVATLGRSLSSLGEKVLLTDTTSHGLLPFYFGASELREGIVRTFSPPSGSTDAPIYLVNYAVDQSAGDDATQEHVVEEITKGGRGAHRILLDLTSNTGWLIRRMAHLNPTVLVPLAPDMNSVISLQAIEKFLHSITSPEGTPVQVFYLLNQFDASLPLHLDVREVLRRQLGERLLPFVIRRAPAVSEALAEGMTIVDYAADAPAAEDYMNVAGWLRTVAAPATAGFRNVRWSER